MKIILCLCFMITMSLGLPDKYKSSMAMAREVQDKTMRKFIKNYLTRKMAVKMGKILRNLSTEIMIRKRKLLQGLQGKKQNLLLLRKVLDQRHKGL